MTALPFLEIGEAAPATVVLACVLALGDDEFAWRLFGDDDDKEPRSAAEGSSAPRWPRPVRRHLGELAALTREGGKQAVVELMPRAWGHQPLAPKSADCDARRRGRGDQFHGEVMLGEVQETQRLEAGGLRTSSRCTRSCRSGSGGAARPASGAPGQCGHGLALQLGQSLGVGVCRQSALKETGANVIVNSFLAYVGRVHGQSYMAHHVPDLVPQGQQRRTPRRPVAVVRVLRRAAASPCPCTGRRSAARATA